MEFIIYIENLENQMKRIIKLFIIAGILMFSSCNKINEDSKSISTEQDLIFIQWKSVYECYNKEQLDKENFSSQIKNLHDSLKLFSSNESNAYPQIRIENTNLIKEINKNLEIINSIIENPDFSKSELLIYMDVISNTFLNLEHNEYLSLKETNSQYVNFFILLIISCFFIVGFLIYFNNKELKDTKKQLDASKQYLKYIIKTQEDERSRISRELHDTVAQDMRYVRLLAGNLPDNELAQEVQQRQSDCINQIRNLCYNFAPPDIKAGKLKEALQTLIASFLDQTKIDVRLTVLDNVDFSVFNSDELLHFYRIVQEALTNIKKHAQASEATVLFRTDVVDGKNQYKLVITDDGIGIKPELLAEINNTNALIKKEDGNHFGISGMKERVALLNGSVHFSSIEDDGTEIVILVER